MSFVYRTPAPAPAGDPYVGWYVLIPDPWLITDEDREVLGPIRRRWVARLCAWLLIRVCRVAVEIVRLPHPRVLRVCGEAFTHRIDPPSACRVCHAAPGEPCDAGIHG